MLLRTTSVPASLRLLPAAVCALVVGVVLALPGRAIGFQPAAEPVPADAAAAPADAAAAPAAATPPEGAAAPAAGAAATEPAAPPAQQKTVLGLIAEGLGWIWGPIFLILSFVMVAVVMMNLLQLRRENLLPAAFIELFEQKLQAKDYQGAYDTARADDSFVARVLAAGLGRLNRGYEEAIEGMQEVGEEETMDMEHKIGYLALIGSIAPMLGLLGTVQGMIDAFSVIASSDTSPKPKDLAAGISTAMVTTLAGLIVCIPAMIAFSMFKNRMARLVLEVGVVSEGLMARFNRKPGGGGAAAPAQQAE